VANIYQMFWPDENSTWTQTVTLMSRLLAQPNAGLISIDPAGNGTQLVLRAKTNGTYASAACCPPTFDGTELAQVLGAIPAVNTGFGPTS